ncbi:hypothetical protein ACQKP8_27280, partial [Photobacterium alginatilyticum]|uniref:hypothetical protein n=1 Tax=Photobacterium alginatilyticum TaxID=1775171 RepID=UPI0040691C46
MARDIVVLSDEPSTIDELGSKVHNARNKVRPTEPTKHTELHTKTAECNASPLIALLWQTQGI